VRPRRIVGCRPRYDRGDGQSLALISGLHVLFSVPVVNWRQV
jgi:hypothetical protein